jgi:peptidoglycan hydrolase-like protein with peptidoglycan-binding domain
MMFGFGSTGETVKAIQRIVNVKEDGIYGPITAQAVRVYQRNNGIVEDGCCGPITMSKMKLFPILALDSLKKASEHLWDSVIYSTRAVIR